MEGRFNGGEPEIVLLMNDDDDGLRLSDLVGGMGVGPESAGDRMMLLKYRYHDTSLERVRVWTAEQSEYGQFDIIERSELDVIAKLTWITVRQADDEDIHFDD